MNLRIGQRSRLKHVVIKQTKQTQARGLQASSLSGLSYPFRTSSRFDACLLIHSNINLFIRRSIVFIVVFNSGTHMDKRHPSEGRDTRFPKLADCIVQCIRYSIGIDHFPCKKIFVKPLGYLGTILV
jgi:hypothetical protein